MLKNVYYNYSLFTDLDIYLIKEGRHFNLYDKLGAHVVTHNKMKGVYFAIWAPNAEQVSVVGDFNDWNNSTHMLATRWDSSGIFEGFIPNVKHSDKYKYYIVSKVNDHKAYKADPLAYFYETPPKTASVVWDINYKWNDQEYLKNQKEKNKHDSYISIYEMHIGSWKDKKNINYREIAKEVVEHMQNMGFTHIELLPIMEHPFYGSWGYQTLGYFAPTSRYGTPEDFMFFIDYLHQNNIGVILDWVVAHFPNDEHGLAFFDGTALYEHEDKKKGFHPDWNSLIFNYGRNEVINFLISSACYWLEKYHIDGIRVDAVASMLYLDYSRKDGEWTPNIYGGKENLEAINFIKKLNEIVHEKFPNTITIAEESTAWPLVTAPVYAGGLGFDYKWNMGWMHDILSYMKKDPIYRKYHHSELTFSLIYAFNENFILSLSHDEVVHGKGSLYQKMPVDDWQKYANIRLLFGYQFTHPGKKLLFMGMENGDEKEWNHEGSIDWDINENSYKQGLKKWLKELNNLYQSYPQLYQIDYSYDGFEWIDHCDWEKSIISFIRKGKQKDDPLLIICNFTPTIYSDYRLGVPSKGNWKEIINSDNQKFNGSHWINENILKTEDITCHNRSCSISIKIPPLGLVILKKE